MDINAYNAIQIQSDPRLTNTTASRPESAKKSSSAAGTSDSSVIRRASQLAQQAMQVADSQAVTVDLQSIDTAENAHIAAENITKYGA